MGTPVETVIRDTVRVLVQTGTTLYADDGDWTTRANLRFTGGSEGAAKIFGDATLVQNWGSVEQLGDAAFAAVDEESDSGATLNGLLCRLLKEDPDGDITIDDLTWSAFWWGQISPHQVLPDGADGGRSTWNAVGLGSILDQLTIREGVVLDGAGIDQLLEPGFMPRFNHFRGADRSAGTFTVHGRTCYAFDFTNTGSPYQWTGRQALDLILATAARPGSGTVDWGASAGSGWEWAISDPDGCLDFILDDIDLQGRTVFFALNTIASESRGLTWWITVAGDVATINVQSGISAPMSGDGYSVPAASLTFDLDVTQSPSLVVESITEDASSRYDIIEVRGSHPIVGMTVVRGDALEDYWTATESDAWDANDEDLAGASVHRRFRIKSVWNGQQYDASENGLTNVLDRDTSVDYGITGLTGEREFQSTSPAIAPAWMLTVERMLPCGIQGLFTGEADPDDPLVGSFTADRIGPRHPPVLVTYDGFEYEDQSKSMHMLLDDGPPSVLIDDGKNGNDLADILDGGGIYVTLALRETQPLRVSWERDPGDWRTSTPRVKTIDVQGCELWTILPGTVWGVETDGTALKTITDLLVVRDDRPKLRAILALSRANFSNPAIAARVTDHGILDTSNGQRAGALLGQITSGSNVYNIIGTVRRRSWALVESGGAERWDTTYDSDRIRPDQDAVI